MDASDIRGMDDLGNLIEAARCLGLVQARKAFGQYGPDDAASERGLHASISERSARLRAEVEALTQQVNRLDDTLDSWMCAALPDGWIGALRAENERLRADAAPCVPKMTDAEMVRTESWQSITDELAHAAYLRGIEEGKRQGLAPQDRSAPARHEDMATFAAELKADPAKARKFFQEAGILNEIGALTPEYGGPQEFDYSVINEIGARTVQRAKRLQEISDLLSDQKSLPPELAAKMAERWHELYDSEIAPTAPPAR